MLWNAVSPSHTLPPLRSLAEDTEVTDHPPQSWKEIDTYACIQQSDTVSEWNDKAEAIRERIGRLRDEREKYELNYELERVVNMIRNKKQPGI